jgi:hypothetical protein
MKPFLGRQLTNRVWGLIFPECALRSIEVGRPTETAKISLAREWSPRGRWQGRIADVCSVTRLTPEGGKDCIRTRMDSSASLNETKPALR